MSAQTSDRFSLDFLLRYQTTIYDTLWEHPPRAQANEVHVRSHHVELAVEPTWRLSTDGMWQLGVAAGYGMRVFWPDVHNLRTPRQLLTGPILRPELIVSHAGPVSLRVGPELFWIVTLDPTLRRLVGDGQSLALGAQASIALALGDAYGLALSYRESHALLLAGFSDVERFLTLTLTRRL